MADLIYARLYCPEFNVFRCKDDCNHCPRRQSSPESENGTQKNEEKTVDSQPYVQLIQVSM